MKTNRVARLLPWLSIAGVLLIIPPVFGAETAVGQAPAKVKLGGNANRQYPPAMPGAVKETYKKVGDVDLSLYIYNPAGLKPGDRRPAIVFFFGGGWTNGSPAQFRYQCEYLASRGMIAVTADYRVRSRNQSQVIDSVRDAKSAIRYVRQHAGRLGIDEQRIAASGGSAGGHLAACTALLKEFDEPGEDAAVSSVPNALVLFNPAVSLAPEPGQEVSEQEVRAWTDRAGIEPLKISPAHHVRAGLPPTLTLIGTADRMFASNDAFVRKLNEAENRAEIEVYKDMPHGFFNVGRGGSNAMFLATLERSDKFLASLGYVSGPPTVTAFFE